MLSSETELLNYSSYEALNITDLIYEWTHNNQLANGYSDSLTHICINLLPPSYLGKDRNYELVDEASFFITDLQFSVMNFH